LLAFYNICSKKCWYTR